MKIILFAFIAIVFLSSCKKKEPIITYDYSQYTGTYYGIREYEQLELFTKTRESDAVFASEVTANQVGFMDHFFDKEIPQTTHWISGNSFTHDYRELAFHSDFSQIYFESIFISSSPARETFAGTKTLLPITGNQDHPLKIDLQGTYILNIDKYENLNTINESYIDTVTITMNGFNPIIDNKEFDIEPFHSFYKFDADYNSQMIIEKDLFWASDSIYLFYKTINNQVFPNDTLHHIYSGIKL